MRRKTVGFTIVELLIVVVVIAILASITIVAFNGVQQRTKNTRISTGAQQYNKAFESYKAVNGSYPTYAGCLGANYPNDVCWLLNGAPERSVSANLDTQLREFLPAKPTVSTEYMELFTSYQRTGLVYYISGSYSELRYYMQGNNQSCIGGFTFANEGALTRCIRVLST